MAATILNSPRVIEVSVYVVRAFVQLRDLLAGNKELAHRLKELEERLERKLAGRRCRLISVDVMDAGRRRPGQNGQIPVFSLFRSLHVRIVRPTPAFRRHPHDVLGRILDVARLAMNAILGVDLQPWPRAPVRDEFVHRGRAVA